jgi:hypothetical protein
MILRFRRTLSPWDFAAKHPKPHVIVGHYNPLQQIDEEATGQPSYFAVLGTVQNALSLVGDCSGLVDRETATITLSYALAEDARRVGELLKATPDRSIGDHASSDYASMAFFTYDRQLYDRLRVIRDERMNTIRAAFERGEEVKHAFTDEAVNEPGTRKASPLDDDYGRWGASPMSASERMTDSYKAWHEVRK